jgi:hypothetical protein
MNAEERSQSVSLPPTQVAPYVEGTRTVEIPARVLLPHVVPAYRALFQGG